MAKGVCLPSQLPFLKVSNELTALDFDLACTYRLLRFENERERDRFKTLAAMLGGGDDGDGGNEASGDEHTETW